MMRHLTSPAAVLIGGFALSISSAVAQQITPPFDQDYSWRSLGSVPGVPTPYGGITFKYDDPDVLLIGGSANRSNGAVYAIRVTRDAAGIIDGFQGQATQLSTAPNIDGGLQYGPNNVLFFSQYPIAGVGQIKPGSATVDKQILLGPLGWASSGSCGALCFVPPGYPGAGRLKVVAYNDGMVHDCGLTPDGNGTFDIVNLASNVNVQGGPEGLLYPPPGSPQLRDYAHAVVSEYSGAGMAVYDVDAQGNPIVATRQQFMTGVSGAEGSTIDASTGSFLFSTFGGGNQVLVVDGFAQCGTFANYGSGIPDAAGDTPNIRGTGCATFNRAINFQTGGGPAGAIGAMNIGFVQTNLPLFGGFILTTPDIPIPHTLDAFGEWTTTISTPNDPNLVGNHVYFQAAYFDRGASFGITASYGLDMLVR